MKVVTVPATSPSRTRRHGPTYHGESLPRLWKPITTNLSVRDQAPHPAASTRSPMSRPPTGIVQQPTTRCRRCVEAGAGVHRSTLGVLPAVARAVVLPSSKSAGGMRPQGSRCSPGRPARSAGRGRESRRRPGMPARRSRTSTAQVSNASHQIQGRQKQRCPATTTGRPATHPPSS